MSARFALRDTPIAGVGVFNRLPIGDHRGSLERLFCADDLRQLVGDRAIRQINLTVTRRRGTTRGMHFQHPPFAEMKIVTCLRGRVFDVAVDLRRDSPTFLRWHAELLSPDHHASIVIPEGCAHGFQTLEDDCEMLYLHTAAYASAAEGGVHAEDPRIAIAWPEPIAELSARDAGHPWLGADFAGLVP
ncbi:MAG: dTDP-4-keto-6-deoxy-D-glucose epimerase [Gemmatimonadetes bacterium]|nr:dTDP-4-keto-6-deoxy-D-glucose epimerase [Gemmatimonadota bacterium]